MKKYRFSIIPICQSDVVESISRSIIENKISLSRLQKLGLEYSVTEKGTQLFLEIEPDEKDEEATPLVNNAPNTENSFSFEKPGKNIANRLGGNTYFADKTGIFFVAGGIPHVIEITNDGQFDLKISTDKLKVFLDFYPPAEGGKQIELDEILTRAKKLNIKATINSNIIKEVLYKLEVNPEPVKNVNIAAGKAAVNGIDGKITYYVETNVDFKPQMTPDGRVDFYHLHILNPVEENQDLALYQAHKDGTDGIDVFGSKIKAKEPIVVKFPLGNNTYRDDRNPNLLKSKISGSVIEKDGLIEVTDVFRIDGNVDFSTGSIKSKSSVIITGDVKSGFEVDVGECIEIGGIVEDAKIKAGGDIVIKSGFAGTGKGAIYCEGKVDLKYVHEQKVFSRDTINVSHEVLHSSLFALKRIQVIGGKNMAIYGGYLLAGDSIETNVLGNSYRINTIAEAGYDYRLLQYIEQNQKELIEHKNTLEPIEESYKQIEHFIQLDQDKRKILNMMLAQRFDIFKNPVEFDEKQAELLKINKIIQILISQSKLNKQIASQFHSLLDQKSALFHMIAVKESAINEYIKTIHEPTSAKIKVNRTIYPGVTLRINGIKLIIETEMTNKTFHLSKDKDMIVFD